MPDRHRTAPHRRLRAWTHLGASALGAVHTVDALTGVDRRIPRTPWLGWPAMWRAELPLGYAAAVAVRLALAARAGATPGPVGASASALTLATLGGLAALEVRARHTPELVDRALEQGFALAGRPVPPRLGAAQVRAGRPTTRTHRPGMPAYVARTLRDYRRLVETTVDYGPHGAANRLDIWRDPALPRDGRAPVILHVPGGAWQMAHKRGQAHPLLTRLADLGWVVASMTYRTAPRHPWPAQMVDVKAAIAWLRENVADYGGDPSFLAVTGGSAGGHLTAMAAFTAGEPAYQPGFEQADTRIQAAIPMYGVYSWHDLTGTAGPGLAALLESVVGMPLAGNEAHYRSGSPLHRVVPHAPPFFLTHGEFDSLVPVAGARELVDALRATSREPVVYVELPHARHVYDMVPSVRTEAVVDGVVRFLAAVRAG